MNLEERFIHYHNNKPITIMSHNNDKISVSYTDETEDMAYSLELGNLDFVKSENLQDFIKKSFEDFGLDYENRTIFIVFLPKELYYKIKDYEEEINIVQYQLFKADRDLSTHSKCDLTKNKIVKRKTIWKRILNKLTQGII